MVDRSGKLPRGMYWRGGVIWLRTDPISGRAKSTGSRTLDGAQAFLARREELSASPIHTAAAKATVGDWARRICKIKAKTRSAGTADMYSTKTGHLVRVFGAHCPLVDIDANAIDRYIGVRQGEGVKNNTIQREWTTLHQILKHAFRAGEYHMHPDQVKPIGFSANYVPKTTVLPAEELPILLAGLPPERAAWVCAALSTGGDISDVEQMQPGDYDSGNQTVRMRGTKNRFRKAIIPVPDTLLPLLESALPYLPLNWPRVSKDLPEACERLGITRVTPKDLRRTAGTWLTEGGVELDVLGRWMRHGGAKVAFDVYAKPRPELTGKAIREQMQKRDSTAGPLGGMADAGDLKNAGPASNLAENSWKTRTETGGRLRKQGAENTELLQLAEARVRRLRAAVGVAPELKPALALSEALVEAYHLGAGDEAAQGNLLERLMSLEAEA